MRLVAALSDFWYAHSHYWEGRTWFERVLALGTPDSRDARVLVGYGRLLSFQGELERAEKLLTEGITRAHARGDAVSETAALLRLGWNAGQSGAHERAEVLLEQALLAANAIDDQRIADAATGMALANLGVVARWRGNLDAARSRHEQSLRSSRKQGYALGIIRSLSDLGDIARDTTDFVGAAACYHECLTLLGDRGDLRIVGDVIAGCGFVAAAWRLPKEAATLFGAAEAIREAFGFTAIDPIDRAAHEQTVDAIARELGEQAFHGAWQLGRGLSVPDATVEALSLAPPPTAPNLGAREGRSGLLTPREHDVLALLVAGHTNPAIADTLFISVRTVENHLAHIFAKLGVSTRTAAVAAAISAELITPHDTSSA